MIYPLQYLKKYRNLCFALPVLLLAACQKDKESYVREFDNNQVKERAKAIEASVSPRLDSGLTLKLWANDSMVADPVSIHVDNLGRLFYTRTNRQKHSEIEIRRHPDWEIPSIGFFSVADRSAFLKSTLAPENSEKNQWLDDLNKDGSHDWKDLTVEKDEVYRLEDRSKDGIADFSQMVLNDFNTEVTDVAGAIITHENDLFIGISPDMWRLTDKDEDGLYEEKKSIANGFGVHIGFGGHGMSGLEIGPDGKLYWQIGDLGYSGEHPDKNMEYSNRGVIVRANPDGSDFEVFAFGNRNTHNFVFDDFGNLITVDNDGDHPNESERLVYVVEGADIGWRINWQFGKYRDPDNNTYKVWMDEKMYLPRFEGQANYFLPPLMNYVSGPTGMLYNPGTALSPEYKNTFFIGEFNGNPTTSGIHAFKLEPDGASFKLTETKEVLKGILATGIDFGPDGAMYVADWIQGWDTKNFGRIWKLDVGQPISELRKQTQALLVDDFSEYDENKLSELLGHEDKRVRQKAQFELAKRDEGIDVFKQNLKESDNLFARIHSIWGITQIARKSPKAADELLFYLKDADPEIRAQVARWLGDLRYREAGDDLMPLLNDSSSRVKFFAAEALGKMKHVDAIPALVTMLEDNSDKDLYLRHAGSYALYNIGDANAIAELPLHESKAVRMAAVIALRRFKHEGIINFLDDEDEYIVTEAARAINDDAGIPKAIPALAALLNETTFTNEPLVRRAINANLEEGTEQALKRLLTYAENRKMPMPLRVEAIRAASTWTKPSVVDRVDGYYRGKIERNLESVRGYLAGEVGSLLDDPANDIRLNAVQASSKLGLNELANKLLAKATNDNNAGVRAESLVAVASFNDVNIDNVVAKGLNDPDKSVRVTALSLVPRLKMADEEKTSLLVKVIKTKTASEKQSALSSLSMFSSEKVVPVVKELVADAEKGTLPPEVGIELEEVVMKSESPDVIAKYNQLMKKRSAGPDSIFNRHESALYGGDVQAGRQIFFNNENAQCLRCHSYDDMGGNAGPRLNGIGSRLTKKQLLEALVQPSKRIAPGFGTIALELKDGKRITGILQEETENSYRLSRQKQDTLIVKEDVASFRREGSSMPPMHLLLSKRQIRDLVSFLEQVKE